MSGEAPSNQIDINADPPEYSAIQMEENDSQINCSICLEDMTNVDNQTTTTCDHTFHRDCIDRWLARHNTCPVCRTQLHNNPVEGRDWDDPDLDLWEARQFYFRCGSCASCFIVRGSR